MRRLPSSLTSQSLTLPSQLPLARTLPSGAKASPVTQAGVPGRASATQVSWPGRLRPAHSRIVPAKSPLASRCPLGLQASAIDRAGMRHLLQEGAQLRIPEPDGRIKSATGEQAAIGGKGQADGPGMPTRPEQGSTLDVPQLDAAIHAPAGELAFVRPEGDSGTISVCACQARCKVWPAPRHSLTSPRLPAAAQYCPLWLMATVHIASKVSVKKHSWSNAPDRFASCISTPCRCTPRKTSRERSSPRRCPRSTRSNVTRLAGPYPVLCPAAHLLQQRAQARLHLDVPRRTALEAGQQGSHQQTLLGLPHIVLGLRLREGMLMSSESLPCTISLTVARPGARSHIPAPPTAR